MEKKLALCYRGSWGVQKNLKKDLSAVKQLGFADKVDTPAASLWLARYTKWRSWRGRAAPVKTFSEGRVQIRVVGVSLI